MFGCDRNGCDCDDFDGDACDNCYYNVSVHQTRVMVGCQGRCYYYLHLHFSQTYNKIRVLVVSREVLPTTTGYYTNTQYTKLGVLVVPREVLLYYLGKALMEKKRFLLGIAWMRGGGLPMPELFGPFFKKCILVNK